MIATFLPSAEDFKCPEGHPVEFRVSKPAEYSSGGALCDICDQRIHGRFHQGVYHCTDIDCRATYPARGWDMCVDCAVRRLLSTQRLLVPPPNQRPQEMVQRPSTVYSSTLPCQLSSELARLPFDTLEHTVAFLDQRAVLALMLVSRTLLHIVGVHTDNSLYLRKCSVCQTGDGGALLHDRNVAFCTACEKVFHTNCCMDCTKCPSCPHALAPASQLSYRTLTMHCPLCRYDHHYLMPKAFEAYRVSNSGDPKLDGLYQPSPLPSDGVALFLRSGHEAEGLLAAIFRIAGIWYLGYLGARLGADVLVASCVSTAASPPLTIKANEKVDSAAKGGQAPCVWKFVSTPSLISKVSHKVFGNPLSITKA